MATPRFEVSVRAHLERLAAAVGGDWALAEVEGAGLRAVATSPGLAAELAGPAWADVLQRAEASGIVVRVGSGTAVHPSARAQGRPGTAGPRFLVGDGIPRGGLKGAEAALVAVVADLLQALSLAARRAEEDHRRAERLELRASTDPLTGLLNRRGWDRLVAIEEDRCQRHGLSAEIVVVDLDGLKRVNDDHGHEAGDALLIRAATYIFSAVRVHDAVARLGGDEFGVLAVGTDSEGGAVGRRIESSLAEVDIAASMGACNRAEAANLAEAWRIADLRMYRAKQRKRRSAGRRLGTDLAAGTAE
ncbi:MAG TPA: GGDEF domain-containing protein [Acidimicrobiales bacterium]